MQFSPNNELVATCDCDHMLTACEAKLWNVATGLPVGNPLRHRDGVRYFAFSEDGTKIVTCGEDFEANLWDVKTTLKLIPPMKHKSVVVYASFSSDGKLLVTLSEKGKACIWDVRSGLPLISAISAISVPERWYYAAINSGGSRIVFRSPNFECPFWTQRSICQSKSDWLLFSKLLSSSKFETMDADPLNDVGNDLSFLKNAWNNLSQKYPDAFQTSAEEIKEWHVQQAYQAEQDHHESAALFHMDHLIKLDPEDKSLLDRRDQILQRLNKP